MFLAEALHRIANGAAASGDFDRAVPLFEEAARFAPGDSGITFDYAKACFDADSLVRAKELAHAAVIRNPTPQTRLLLARVEFHLGEFAAAKADLEALFDAHAPFDVGYLLAKTDLLLHRDAEARAVFDDLLRRFGDTPEIRVYIGRAYSENDQRDNALAEFHWASAEDDRARDVHYFLGLAYLGHNEAAGYAQAVPEFRAELKRNPNDFRSHYMLGYIALKQHDLPQAERELLAALALQGDNLESLVQLATTYTEEDRLAEAEAAATRAVAIARGRTRVQAQAAQAHYVLGRLLAKTGRHDEAQREMARVAEIQKRLGPSSAQIAGTRTNSDDDGPTSKQVPNAEREQLEAYIQELRPAVADAYNNLGAIAAQKNDFREAVRSFREAAAWDPNIEGLDRNLGRAEFLSGEFQQAVLPLSRYLQQHPQDQAVRTALGLAYYRLGDYDKVVEVLAPIADSIQSNPELADAYAVSTRKRQKQER